MVRLNQSLREQLVADGQGIWDVQGAAEMKMSNFGVAKAEFDATEAVWTRRYSLPRGYLFLDLLNQVAHSNSILRLCFSLQRNSR